LKNDFVIVGAGIVGLSTALAAAKQGLRVACVDSYGINNLANASTDESRLFRLSYFENPAYVPLLMQSREAWHSLSEGLLVECGGFYAGPMESELIDGSLKSAIQNGLDYELMSQPQAKEQFPQFQLPGHYWCVFEKNAGYVRALTACQKMAQMCIDWGVQFFTDEVLSIDCAEQRWQAVCNERNLFGNRMIICAGNATSTLVPQLSSFLTPEPHTLRWLVPDYSVDWTTAPGFGIMDEQNQMLYGFPGNVGIPGVKVGGHQSVDTKAQGEMAANYLRGLTDHVCATRSCAYDMSPDGHFILGEIEPNLSVACGFSGHGFKFGSVIGDLVLNAADRALPKELDFLSVNRYLIRS
jgi:sarcosine oxidase